MARMTFSGRNLERLRDAVALACDELHNQIATCPDPDMYEEDIADLEAEQQYLLKMLSRIDAKITGVKT